MNWLWLVVTKKYVRSSQQVSDLYNYYVESQFTQTHFEAKDINEVLWLIKARDIRGEVVRIEQIGTLTR